MKRIMVLLLGILLLIGAASAEETASGILGKPFPDFTVTDTEGNTFTLSEALKDREAVLINFWATWCGPCRSEFPFLNEAYEKYQDRVAFIALSAEKKDTVEKIAEYREANGISFPMGRDESQGLDEYVDTTGIPDTVIVDRFGCAVFFHRGAFSNAESVGRVLDTFLGDGYTETAVLNEIPKDISTHAFPVSAARAIYPESGNYRKIIFRSDIIPKTVAGYIVPDDAVRLRIEIAADDDAVNMVFADLVYGERVSLPSLLDSERGVYVYDQEMPDMSDAFHYVVVVLYDDLSDEDSEDKDVKLYLFINEESVNELV